MLVFLVILASILTALRENVNPPGDYKIHTVPHKTSVKLINTLNILDNPLRVV
jgi:hypothetical protein